VLRESFYRRMAELALRLSSSSDSAKGVAPLISIAGDMVEKAQGTTDVPPVSRFTSQEEQRPSGVPRDPTAAEFRP
jgi:hypothetical protein